MQATDGCNLFLLIFKTVRIFLNYLLPSENILKFINSILKNERNKLHYSLFIDFEHLETG